MAKNSDEKEFNETVKRLLETPPKHHEDEKKGEKKKPKKDRGVKKVQQKAKR